MRSTGVVMIQIIRFTFVFMEKRGWKIWVSWFFRLAKNGHDISSVISRMRFYFVSGTVLVRSVPG